MIWFAFHKYTVVFCRRSGFPGRGFKLEISLQMFVKECPTPVKRGGWRLDWAKGRVGLQGHPYQRVPDPQGDEEPGCPSELSQVEVREPGPYTLCHTVTGRGPHWVRGLTLSEGAGLGYPLHLRHQSADSWRVLKISIPTAGATRPSLKEDLGSDTPCLPHLSY